MKRTVTITLSVMIVLAIAFAGFALWVRVAPSDPARWHVDPAIAPRPGTPNFAEADRVVALPLDAVAEFIAARAHADGALVLTGDAAHQTWIARSRLMRFPDYVSIRLTPETLGEETGTRVQAFSRARFGYSDAGVNRARLQRWLPQ